MTDFLDSMRSLDIPEHMVLTATELAPNDIRGLLVYGSRARGDALANSDLDLLALVERPIKWRNREGVSLSFYTQDELMRGRGSLFGAHLRRDAQIIHDPENVLRSVIQAQTEVDVPRLLHRVREFSVIFGSLDRDLPKYLPGILREARYLLRSALYAKAIGDGNECFSVRELAQYYGDPELSELLASRMLGRGSVTDLYECLARLTDIVGPPPVNRHGSLESLIVNEWHPGADLMAIAMLALGDGGSELEYVEFGTILL